MRVVVYRYTYWDEKAQAMKRSKRYASLDMLHNGLGAPVYADTLTVEREDLVGGLYDPDKATRGPKRAPTEIFAEFLERQKDIRALTTEWMATANELRRAELEALIDAARVARRLLFAEYKVACADRRQGPEDD